MSTRHTYLTVAGRLRAGMSEIDELVARTERIWQLGSKSGDDWFVDAVALNLHGFYAGVERLLRIVVEKVDQSMPTGAGWHVELLAQASAEVPGLRPAILDADLRRRLDRYRGFRHVVRNVYTFNLDVEQIGELVDDLSDTRIRVHAAISGFADLLESLAEGSDFE